MCLNITLVCGEGNSDIANLTLLPHPAGRRDEVNGPAGRRDEVNENICAGGDVRLGNGLS
jgi:hypothetical protein